MASRHSTPIPSELAGYPLRTLRTRDAAVSYAHPRAEVARLAKRGLLHRVANGYYVVVPADMVGRDWIPNLEAAAAGIASATCGASNAVVMGISAARLHGAIPRALATAVVAIPKQHRPISLTDRTATIHFVKRSTSDLDAERIDTPLGPALVTSPEQTILDLAHRPRLGDAEVEIPSAVAALHRNSDDERLRTLAVEQRLMAALRRASMWVEEHNG